MFAINIDSVIKLAVIFKYPVGQVDQIYSATEHRR